MTFIGIKDYHNFAVMEKLKVIYVSPEISPFAQSGEIADVAGSLPKYLTNLGMEVSLFMPKYRQPEIESLPMVPVMTELMVPLGAKKVKGRVYKSELGKCNIYFIDNPTFFWRERIYGAGSDEYLDNDERFVFFNRAVLEFLVKAKIPADIIHCNNWPTALIPVFLKSQYSRLKRFKQTATIFTLNNIAFQGEYPPDTLILNGLNWNDFSSQHSCLKGKFNFLKAGVVFSDVINTVSLTYKKEIQAGQHGLGLEDLLGDRKKNFHVVRNGIDYDIWNPEKDPFIVANYTSSDLKAKKRCKKDLLKEFGLTVSDKTPVLGVASYLAANKGIDILLKAITGLMEMELGVVVLGRGDEAMETQLVSFQKKYPGKIAVNPDFVPGLIHKIMAGSDMILVPSRYEPCGLNVLYGFRYGTVPIVRATGGLKEMISPFDAGSSQGNGFIFQEYSAEALLVAVREAVNLYRKPRIWKIIMAAGFKENTSWEKSAASYERLYYHALELKRGGKIV